jgi:hypothetical protein
MVESCFSVSLLLLQVLLGSVLSFTSYTKSVVRILRSTVHCNVRTL